GATEPLPQPFSGGGDVDVPVAGRKNAGRNGSRVVVAGLLGHLARDQPARRLEVEHEDLRFQQRRVHPLAATGPLALVEREQDALSQEQARRQIGDGNADPDWALPGQTGDRHQATEPLGDLIDAWSGGVWTGLAEARDAAVHDARVDRGDGIVVDAEAMLYVGTVVLNHHIGRLGELEEDVAPLRALEIEGHGALVAVQVLEVEAVATATDHIAVGGARWLDLDH